MSKKLKGTRPLDDINAEYSLCCGRLGDFTFRRSTIAKEIERLNHRLEELDLEAGSAKQQMEAMAAEDAAKPVVGTDKDGNEYVECTTDECLKASGEVQDVRV